MRLQVSTPTSKPVHPQIFKDQITLLSLNYERRSIGFLKHLRKEIFMSRMLLCLFYLMPVVLPASTYICPRDVYAIADAKFFSAPWTNGFATRLDFHHAEMSTGLGDEVRLMCLYGNDSAHLIAVGTSQYFENCSISITNPRQFDCAN